MIAAIMMDIRAFLVILALTLVSFFFTFMALFPAVDGLSGWVSFYNLAMTLIGGGDSEAYAATTLGQLYLMAFLFFGVVVLLNLLIALMGDSYDRVRENEAVEGLLTRAAAICEIENSRLLRPNFRDVTLFPRFLHILKSKHADSEGGDDRAEWGGRVKALRRVVEQGAEQTRAFQSGTHQQIEAMEDKIDEMSGRMDDMGGKLDKLFELLRQPK